MANIPSHIVDEIMQTARIEEVIGEYVNLKRAGSNLKGLSPFTDEKTPSFVVSPAKQIFKCFSTGKGGSVVTFLMEKEHFSYPEALRWLAEKFNVQIPEEHERTAEELAASTERESLYIINEFAKNHFTQNMYDVEEGKNIGLAYFIERGFRMDIIQKFQLGYCLNKGDDFSKAALAKGFKQEYLESVGLVKSKEERKFDFFSGRVMFPIHSISGRVLGFGGRTLFTDKKIAKYYNSPESIIYNKSEILYGLYFAKGDIVKYDNCFLCEGYTDVISMFQAGVCNVVSSSGTSLTSQQIKLIKRYTQNITILYDGDAAGIKASFRGIDLILEEGLNVKVLLFPDGDDPDSYSKKVSTSELMDFIKANTQDFVRFKTSILMQGESIDPLQRANLIKEISHSISLIPDAITRSVYSKEISKEFDIEEALIIGEINKQKKNQLAKELQTPEIATNSSLSGTEVEPQPQIITPIFLYAAEEYELMRVLMKFGNCSVEVLVNGDMKEVSIVEMVHYNLDIDALSFSFPLFQQIYSECVEGLNERKLFKASYWLRHQNLEVVSLITDMETEKHSLSPKWLEKHGISTKEEQHDLKKWCIDVIYGFKLHKIIERTKLIEIELALIENQSDEESQKKLLHLLTDLNHYRLIKLQLSTALGRIAIN